MRRTSPTTRRGALRTCAAAAGLLGVGTRVGSARSDDAASDDTCHFQVDLVAGDPIERLGESDNDFYGRQNRLIQYVHGDATGVTERDTWLNSLDPEIRRCVDASQIRVDVHGGTASVRFRVDSDCERTLSLVSYPLPGGEFSFDTEQTLADAATRTFGGPGSHELTLTVDLPCEVPLPEFEIDGPTTITEPGVYVLTDDVEVTDGGVGIQIGAEGAWPEGVELVGNGYAVRGPGVSGDDDSDWRNGTVGMKMGTHLSGSPDDVVVRDVTVAGFDTGVEVVMGYPAFESATVANNGFGVYAVWGGCAFSRGVLRDNGVGVDIHEGGSHFERNRVVDSELRSHFGGPTLVGNELVRSDVSTHYGGGEIENNDFRDCGVSAGEASVLVADNLIEENDGAGIALEYSSASIRGNTVRASGGDGIALKYSRPSLYGNTVRTSSGDGIWLVGSDGWMGNNLVEGNDGDGITLESSADYLTVTVRSNTVRANGADGVRLVDSKSVSVRENTVRDNGGDGIELVGSDDNAVVDNVVCGNADGAIVLDEESTENTVQNNTTNC